jgi:hypothetical protein
MTYTEGWPKTAHDIWGAWEGVGDDDEALPADFKVVPLSDAERLREQEKNAWEQADAYIAKIGEAEAKAERLREALEWVARNTYESPTQKKARAALREGEGEELRQLGVPYTDDLDREGEGA